MSGDAKRLQNSLLPSEHHLGIRFRHMIIAAQMEHAVRNQESKFAFSGMTVFLRLQSDTIQVQNDISQNQIAAFRIQTIYRIRSGKY